MFFNIKYWWFVPAVNITERFSMQMFVPGAGNAAVSLVATAPALTEFMGTGEADMK